MERELFVVQRCWHSGPQQYQPLDYLRLFLSQKDAEEAAFHSACAWDRHHKPTGETSVKTLLLPAYPASNTTGSSYGFISHGCLFWVRSLIAFVGSDQNQGHAVITEGVIGGTGNRMSRRGTEVSSGRVFVGDEAARFAADRAWHHVTASLTPNCSSYVATMPIGKPKDYTTNQFLQDWPLFHSNFVDNKNKRDLQWQNTTFDEGIVVECPFELPSAKRRRFCTNENSSNWQNKIWAPQAAGEEGMLMG